LSKDISTLNQSPPQNPEQLSKESIIKAKQHVEGTITVIDMDISNTAVLSTNFKNSIKSENTSNFKKNFVVNGKTYIRSELVGKGGSCKVFKVYDSEGKIYALKRVKLRGQDPSVAKGYANEITLLNKLKNHERIIKIIDADKNSAENVLQMVLEFGEIDLEKMLQKDPNTPLSINTIRNYWEQVYLY
jgi:serine/threonine protein kinase